MSLPLRDHRTSIDETTDMWLEIEAAIQRKEKAAISREILREWASSKDHAHKLAARYLQAHGDEMAYDGTPRSGDAAKAGGRK